MPNYEFQCQACKKQFMKSMHFGSKDLPPCPVCEGNTKRLITAPMVHFKGSGFYKTDSSTKPASTETAPAPVTPAPAATPPPPKTA